jgi:hypothetical protein
VTASGDRMTVTGGAAMSPVAETTRPGGIHQLTYAGHPLYTFTGDTGPGSTSGQGSEAFGPAGTCSPLLARRSPMASRVLPVTRQRRGRSPACLSSGSSASPLPRASQFWRCWSGRRGRTG